MSFGPTLTLCMSYSTKMMELFPLHILTTLFPWRRSFIVTLTILHLSLISLVLWRWTTVHSLVSIFSISKKLTSVARLATLNTLQSRSMSTRPNPRRRITLLNFNHWWHLIREALHLLNHGLPKSKLTSIQPSLHFLEVKINSMS